MDNIQDVLKRAHDEGKIGAAMLPWHDQTLQTDRTTQADQNGSRAVELQTRPSAIPETFLADMQRTVENIKTEAGQKNYKVIGFTSAKEREGTSTLLAATATILAGQGDKVLLLDAQSSRPALNTFFKKALSPGLAELLANQVDFETCVHSIAGSGLDLLTHGDHSAAISGAKKLAAIVSETRNRYSWILLDLPPVIEHAEALALSKICDAIILTVRANETRREAVRSAVDQLARTNVPVLGTILNKRKFYLPEGIYKRL